MLITQSELEDFIGKFPEEGDTKPEKYCKSAQEMIAKYLQYDPEEKEYATKVRGDDGVYAVLEAFPITEIISFKVDGEEQPITLVEIANKNLIRFEDDSKFLAGHKYEITYKAGYKEQEMPEIIKTTALQIGTLLWESAGGNLAVSSTSFADTGSRVFNNFTADRFLQQIISYKRNM